MLDEARDVYLLYQTVFEDEDEENSVKPYNRIYDFFENHESLYLNQFKKQKTFNKIVFNQSIKS